MPTGLFFQRQAALPSTCGGLQSLVWLPNIDYSIVLALGNHNLVKEKPCPQQNVVCNKVSDAPLPQSILRATFSPFHLKQIHLDF